MRWMHKEGSQTRKIVFGLYGKNGGEAVSSNCSLGHTEWGYPHL